MPCGIKDRRRAGHRCLRCRKDHLKCDGTRPCSSCVHRGISCTSPNKTSREFMIVQVHPINPVPVIQKPITNLSWRYATTFFHVIETSKSPVFSLFSYNSVSQLLQQKSVLHDVICLVGGYYASKNTQFLTLSKSERNALEPMRLVLRDQLSTEMKTGQHKLFDVLLVAGLLYGFVELMDQSGIIWRCLMHRILLFVMQNRHSKEFQSPSVSQMYRIFRVCNAFRAICFDENVVPIIESDPGCSLPPVPSMNTSAKQKDEYQDVEQVLDQLSADLESCADLIARGLQWTNTNAHEKVKLKCCPKFSPIDTGPKQGTPEHTKNGIEIICSASKLQRELIGTILSYSQEKDKDPAVISILPYYYWSLTEISRIFWHPMWQSLDCPLPIMGQDLLRQQAISALDNMEKRLDLLQFDAVMYVPIIFTLAMEMRESTEQMRMLRFMKTIEIKGFKSATAPQEEIQGTWMGHHKPDCKLSWRWTNPTASI